MPARPIMMASLLTLGLSAAPAHCAGSMLGVIRAALPSRRREDRTRDPEGSRRAASQLQGAHGGKPYPRWNGALRRVDLPGREKVVALTFDLCEQPHEIAGYQGDLIDYLRDHNIPATFFAGGKWLLTHPERAQQLMADPLFEIGDHTWDHANLRLVSGGQLNDEIVNAQAAYMQEREVLGRKQCLEFRAATAENRAPERMTLFRFPFGACDEASLSAVEYAGLRAVQWDIAAADPSKGQTADKIVPYVVGQAKSGSIIIFHANGRGWHTGEALPKVVEQLTQKGFTFKTVSGLLNMPGAKPVVTPTCYDVKPANGPLRRARQDADGASERDCGEA